MFTIDLNNILSLSLSHLCLSLSLSLYLSLAPYDNDNDHANGRYLTYCETYINVICDKTTHHYT